MKRLRFVVDWDDTLVEDRWPEQGPWLPGAVDALREMDARGDVVIFSCRVSPYAFPSQPAWHQDVHRDPADVDNEVFRMRAMLVEVGLGHVEIWQRPYKPSGTVYIDNKGLRFTGDWRETMENLYDHVEDLGRLPMTFKRPGFTVADEEREKLEAQGYPVNPFQEDNLPPLEAKGLTFHPTHPWVGTPLKPARHPNSARFHELLVQAGELHDRKQADYGRDSDPFANVRGSADWGMPAWVGAMVRATDKIRRLQTFARKGELANEAVEDAFMDLAVYALIGLVLYEQEREA